MISQSMYRRNSYVTYRSAPKKGSREVANGLTANSRNLKQTPAKTLGPLNASFGGTLSRDFQNSSLLVHLSKSSIVSQYVLTM